MMALIQEIPYALLIGGAALLGLYLANLFYDAKIPQYISRKLGHLGGAVAFLLCPFLFSSFWWPFVLTIGFTAMLLWAHIAKPTAFRGVGGSGRPNAFAEVNFPATGIVTIGVGWGLLHAPWLAIVPLLFMGAGDSITGIIRSKIYNREMKGWWGSLGMLATCLLLASFYRPYWVGAIGVLAAVLAEKFTKTTAFVDDNLTVPIVSFIVMGALSAYFGYL